jgi:Damage-control phosphatase ARMT1-like domain
VRRLVPGAARTVSEDPRPAPLTGADPSSFAYGVLHRRHRRLVEQARNSNPYSPDQVAGLDRLAAELDGPIGPLTADGHDAAEWRTWSKPHLGRRWDEVPFLWAESYFYRRLLDAVGFFTPGPGYWLDPFGHLKAAELDSVALDAELAELDWIADVDPAQRLDAILRAALRGNRADLGFAAHSARFELPEVDVAADDLVVDDTERTWAALGSGGSVCLVADNAGRELLADLLLVDELLAGGRASEVVLHVKPTPYFVSDATAADVAAGLRRLGVAGGHAAVAARRLQEEFRRGRVRLRTSWFHTAPFEFDAMPDELAADFAHATLTVLKGDLNYRRLVGDRAWPPSTDPSAAAAYFPGPVVALRTLKSELVIGVPDDRVAALDRRRPDWRIAGTHAMVQFVDGGPAAG